MRIELILEKQRQILAVSDFAAQIHDVETRRAEGSVHV